MLIYGAGAIGCHLAYCLKNNRNKIFLLTRGKNYERFIKKGLNLYIFQNKILKKRIKLTYSNQIKFINNIKQIDCDLDFIFITVKLKDDNSKLYNHISKLIKKKTAIIPPCTSLPTWWYLKFGKKFNVKINSKYRILKEFKKNIIGMTMWLSSVIDSPGIVSVKHVQRGYPLKEIDIKMKNKADYLRKLIKKKCKSPFVKNIYSEIYLKSVNSLAFNIIALKTKKSNFRLKKDKNAIKNIYEIMDEFDSIIIKNKIKITQSINSRIKQTLSSTNHTMSMLSDFQKKRRVELRYSWLSFKPLITKILVANKSFNFYRKVKMELIKKNLF